MTAYEVRIDGRSAEPAEGWTLQWLDRATGIGRLSNGARSLLVLVEGSGRTWTVTIHGRRIAVQVHSWRERVLAEAEVESSSHAGPIEVRATLPGLVVAIAKVVGDEVDSGEPLLTIEAMKMQNEVRAPRAGRVASVAVAIGQAIGAGTVLVRLE